MTSEVRVQTDPLEVTLPEQHKALSADSEETRESALTLTISAAIKQLYARFYGHDRTTATTYNVNVVVRVLQRAGELPVPEAATPAATRAQA